MAAASPERGSSFVYFLFGLLLGAGLTYLLLSDGNNLLSFTPSESTPRLSTMTPSSPADSPIRPTSRPLTARPPSPTRAPLPPPTTGAPAIVGDERLLGRMRLPTGIRPSHYDLTIQVFLPEYKTKFDERLNYVFNGSVAVNFTSSLPFKTVVLNQKDLSFERNLSLYLLRSAATKEQINPIELRLDNDFDFITFEFEKQLLAGEYTLQIPFDGKMRQPFGKLYTNGLYGSSYIGANGTEQVGAFTQFEPYDARRMVPCFDEPEFKASWRVEIIHPKGTKALSNQEIKSQLADEKRENWLETRFETTPVMSSYLLAIAVMDYSSREYNTHNGKGIAIRIWAPPHDLENAEWALEAGWKVMDAFERKFKISYPMKKCDMIVVNDYAAGAMENWGLITYERNSFLYNKKVDTMDTKQWVGSVVAHELAHMWFGNLVTMRWWSNLWLNEGFATFAQVIGLDFINGSKAFESELTDRVDALVNTFNYDISSWKGYPMSWNITRDFEVKGMFDSNSYAKGGSFIYMLKGILGEELFYKGIENYLRRYSYSNSWETDLFREFDQLISEDFRYSDPAGKGIRFNVTKFGIRWTRQKGSPIVTLQPVNKTHLEITQRRYIYGEVAEDQGQFTPNFYEYKWDVPIWLVRGDGRKEFHWLPADGRLFIETSSPNEAIVLNEDSTAIARTNYTKQGWRNVIEQLKKDHTVFSTKTRHRFLYDLLSYSKLDLLQFSFTEYLDVYSYLQREDHKLPWELALSFWKNVIEKQTNVEIRREAHSFMYKLITSRKNPPNLTQILANVHDDVSFRANLLDMTLYYKKCNLINKECDPELAAIFIRDFYHVCQDADQPASQCSRIPVWLKPLAYCSGLRLAEANSLDAQAVLSWMEAMKRKETHNGEASRIVYAMQQCRPTKPQPADEKGQVEVKKERLLHPWMKKDENEKRRYVKLLNPEEIQDLLKALTETTKLISPAG